MKAAELFVKCLEEQGVEYIFGVPGEENIHLLDAINQSSIQFIVCRHETGAAFIAGVMGKLTGKPGVCLSTLGPGATNMVTGVACATLDRMPLIAITAQTGLAMQHNGSHQYVNLLNLYSPITKWSAAILDGSIIPEVVSKAFTLALSNLPGAIHIELPSDIASSLVQGKPLQHQPVAKKGIASEQAINDVASAINEAKFPIVIIGSKAVRENTASAILSFIEKLQIPFIETYMAKGVVPGNHPLHLQTIGLPEGDFVNQAFSRADLVISIGYDSIEYSAKKWNPLQSPIIHIDINEHEIDRYYPVKATLLGDVSMNLLRLTDQLQQRNEIDPFYRNLKETITNDLLIQQTSDTYPLAPQFIIKGNQGSPIKR